MSFVIKDRVAETTTTTGTGTVTLLGAVRGYQGFTAIADGNTTCYLILAGDGVGWEVGVGTYTANGTTLSRTTILSSSNSGSAITLSGTSLVMCTNPANQTAANGLFDQLFGAVDGYVPKRVAGVWTGSTIGAGGSGGGLYNPDLSAVPTVSSTGLATWINQGSATMTDTTEGVFLDIDAGHASQLCGKKWSAAVPATPYSITALIGFTCMSTTGNPFVGLGWTDGTKFHIIETVFVSAADYQLSVNKWNTSSSFNGGDFSGVSGTCERLMWYKIKDDGTNVIFSTGTSPKSMVPVFSVAKASGFLGGSGYTSICFVGDNSANGKELGGEILSWTQGT